MIDCKQNCKDDLAASIRRSAGWRRRLQKKYNDPHCGPAADLLERLATESNDLSDEMFLALSPFYSWSSGRWADSVSETCRLVGFRGVDSLSKFVDTLVSILSKPVAA